MAKKKFYRYPLYLLVRLGAGILKVFPRGLAYMFATPVGWIAYYVVVRQRKKAIQNLRTAFGTEKTEKEIKDIGKKLFCNLLKTAIDIFHFSGVSLKKMKKLVDNGNIPAICKDLLSEGKGLIIMTAHIGNWELLAGMLGLEDMQGAMVARRVYYEPYNNWIVNIRKANKIETIYRHEAIRGIHESLKKNRIIGLASDQDIDSLRGVFVDFFGKSAYTSIAPVKIALSTKAPIMTLFLVHTERGKYKMILGDIIRPKIKTTKDEAVLEYTKAWSESLENVIRKYPDQWVWMHNRWKTEVNGKNEGKNIN